jgi:hypothetical protein
MEIAVIVDTESQIQPRFQLDLRPGQQEYSLQLDIRRARTRFFLLLALSPSHSHVCKEPVAKMRCNAGTSLSTMSFKTFPCDPL